MTEISANTNPILRQYHPSIVLMALIWSIFKFEVNSEFEPIFGPKPTT